MSEGTSGAAQAARSHIASREDYWAGVILIGIAILGPVLGVLFGRPPRATEWTVLDGLRAGAYSLPLAVFGAIPVFVRVRSPRDFYGGVSLVALALFALWASTDLPGMRGFAFGPGTAPRLFAYCLLALGVAVALVGLLTDGPPMEDFTFSGSFGGAVLVLALIPIYLATARLGRLFPGVPQDIVVAAFGSIVVVVLAFALMNLAPRGPLFITAATIVFAIAVRPLGLVIATYVSLVVSAAATRDVHWIESLIWCAVLTAFCALLFPYGLNLPLQLWPRF